MSECVMACWHGPYVVDVAQRLQCRGLAERLIDLGFTEAKRRRERHKHRMRAFDIRSVFPLHANHIPLRLVRYAVDGGFYGRKSHAMRD